MWFRSISLFILISILLIAVSRFLVKNVNTVEEDENAINSLVKSTTSFLSRLEESETEMDEIIQFVGYLTFAEAEEVKIKA